MCHYKLSTEWHYRQLSIELNRRGFRTSELQGLVEREKSLILDKIFSTMRAKGIKRGEILDQLSLPLDEISTLTFNNNFFMEAIEGSGNNVTLKPKDTFLKLVK
ncbi:Uncharacterised protein [Yersinia pekkanenii]|uniref:Uncharacterized protein n=1 Tax=Yersinia pekkanenii TaxID=1288385 RepID=A0A0T9P9M2_9GAMM|nr:Uncharacterised protein [Yersinia pekkanenii]CRY69556.1 Uncharacterised protein [Yersinia pekkanenii]